MHIREMKITITCCNESISVQSACEPKLPETLEDFHKSAIFDRASATICGRLKETIQKVMEEIEIETSANKGSSLVPEGVQKIH